MRAGSRARHRVAATLVGAALVLGGCAGFAPGAVPPGTPIDDVRRTQVGLTGDHALPDGGRRLEYAMGAFGKQTWMLDFDAAGRLVSSRQVLTERDFAAIVPGMTQDEVRVRLGRPVWVIGIARQQLRVWNYRWFQGDCVWFQVSITDAGVVKESGYGQDPACNQPDGSWQ